MRRLLLFLGVGLIAVLLFGAGVLTAVQVVGATQDQGTMSPMTGHMGMMAGSGDSAMSPAECNGQHAAMHGGGMMGNGMMGNGMMGHGMMGQEGSMPGGMHAGSCPFQATPPADQ